MKRTFTALLLGVALVLLTSASAQAADCEFRLGFKTLRDLIGHDIVGECLENEHYNEISDSNQQTTGGLMAWRKADNWTAFTDGYRSWINGPNGLVQRLNTERFSWEADYAPGGGIATPNPTSTSTPTPAPTSTIGALAPGSTRVVRCLEEWAVLALARQRLVDQGVFGYWADVMMTRMMPRITTVTWVCERLKQLGYDIPDDFDRQYVGYTAFRHTALCLVEPSLTEQEALELVDALGTRELTDFRFNAPCRTGAAEVQSSPTPPPIYTPIPTPTPAPERYVDPVLAGALQLLRTTEWGETVYQEAYLGTNVTELAFANLDEYGWSGFAALLDPVVERDSILFRILFDNRMRAESQGILTALLVHELMHAFDQANSLNDFTEEGCLKSEILAYNAQAKWWYEKFGENGKKYPTELEAIYNSLMWYWVDGTVDDIVRGLEEYRQKCAGFG